MTKVPDTTTTTVVQTIPQAPAQVARDIVGHLAALADAGDRLDALVGADVRAAMASSIHDGTALRIGARRLDDLIASRPDVAAAAGAVQGALRAVEASSPRLMAACAAGPLDPGVRAAVVRARHAAQHATDWIPPLRPPPDASTGFITPAQRVARALTWGLSSGEARRWLGRARAQAALAAAIKPGAAAARIAPGQTGSAAPAGKTETAAQPAAVRR